MTDTTATEQRSFLLLPSLPLLMKGHGLRTHTHTQRRQRPENTPTTLHVMTSHDGRVEEKSRMSKQGFERHIPCTLGRGGCTTQQGKDSTNAEPMVANDLRRAQKGQQQHTQTWRPEHAAEEAHGHQPLSSAADIAGHTSAIGQRDIAAQDGSHQARTLGVSPFLMMNLTWTSWNSKERAAFSKKGGRQ